MVYTVTLNPSLDYIADVECFTLGRVNRTERELIFPGGKGVNVSLVLKNLCVDSTALGFVAGFTGKEIERRLKEWGCFTQFFELKNGMSRINLKLRSNQESEINGQGPAISRQDMEQLYRQLDQLKSGDMLVLAGSIPRSLSDSAYEEIMAHVKEKKIHCIVDAAGDLLKNVLKYNPFLIKPNNHEMEEIFHCAIDSTSQLVSYGKKLQDMGARNVLISMAGDGAILLAEDGSVYKSEAPKGKVMNSVGAGDSMVAGFICGYMKHKNYMDALKMGIAAGSASAFSDRLATKEEVDALIQTVEIQ